MSRYVLLMLLLITTPALAEPEIGKPAPDFNVKAINGKAVTLSDYKGKIVVLEWNNPGCPFVHKHYDSGNMQKLQTYATGKGVIWLTIDSGAPGKQGYMNALEAKDYLAKQGAAMTQYILDPEGAIGKLYAAKTTPHMFVIDANGNLAYMGAIDDQSTPDPKTVGSAHNYVKAAIDSLIAGEPIAVTSTQSYGCSVKYGD